MKTYTITESKAQLSALVEKVLKTGEPIVIGRAGKPMVQLAPYRRTTSNQRLGAFEGQIRLREDFAEWDQEEADALGMKR